MTSVREGAKWNEINGSQVLDGGSSNNVFYAINNNQCSQIRTQMHIIGASVHTGKAAVRATLRKADKDGANHEDVVSDNPNLQMHAARSLDKPVDLKLGSESLVVECEYDHQSNEKPIRGGLGDGGELCFGTVTYTPPSDVQVCTSLPSERTLESAFGMDLEKYEDLNDRKRRKRQSDRMVDGFWDRLQTDPAGKKEKVKFRMYDKGLEIYDSKDSKGVSKKAEEVLKSTGRILA